MRVVITGVAGHIGSALATYLLGMGHEVIGVDDFSSGYPEQVPAGVMLQQINLATSPNWRLPSKTDFVFHLAAYAAECFSPFCRRFNYQNNVGATMAVVNECIRDGGVRRLVFASSIAVYGDVKAPFKETDICRPKDPYGNAKLACERDIQIAADQHGLEYCIVRPHNVYGPGQSIWQKYRNVFGLWLRAALERRDAIIFGDGMQQRSFVYIDDLIPALWSAAMQPLARNETFNLGGGEPVTIKHASIVFADACDLPVTFQYEDGRHEVRSAYPDASRAEAVLLLERKTDLDSGLSKMAAWAKAAWARYPDRRHSDLPDAEVTRGMPKRWLEG